MVCSSVFTILLNKKAGRRFAYPTYGLVGPVSEAPPGKTARSNQRNTISSASTTTAPMLIEATYQRR